jgi:ABC-type amino acid transport substrate-binding protein
MALVRARDQAAFANPGGFLDTTSRLGFARNTTGELVAKAVFLKATLVPKPTVEDGIAALRQGVIDIFIDDAPIV